MKAVEEPTHPPNPSASGSMAKQFLRLSASGRKAKIFVAALVGLMLCINGLNVPPTVLRYFLSAIEIARDWGGFYPIRVALCRGIRGADNCRRILFRFTEERLGLHWREWLTHHVVRILHGATYLLSPRSRRGGHRPRSADLRGCEGADGFHAFICPTCSCSARWPPFRFPASYGRSARPCSPWRLFTRQQARR